jgi:hypothetical protein
VDLSFRFGIGFVVFVIRRLPWWLFFGLIVALVPHTWRAFQGDQAAREAKAAILAAPPPARVDLALDSRQRIGPDGSEVAFRAQVIEALSGPVEQSISSVDLSRIVIYLAAPDASDPQGDVVAAIVVSSAKRAVLDAWLERQTRGKGPLGAIIEVDGLRDDGSTGVALTESINRLYPEAMKNALTRETVVIDGRKVDVTDFDRARYEAEVAPLTSRFIGIVPFFEGRAVALAPTFLPEKGPLVAYGVLILVMGLIARDRWKNRNRPLPQNRLAAYVDDHLRKWITIFSAIWVFIAVGSALEFGRFGNKVTLILIVGGVGYYMWRQIDKNPKYADIRQMFVREDALVKPRQPEDPRRAGPEVRPAASSPWPVTKPASPPFADSPIKTEKRWFR